MRKSDLNRLGKIEAALNASSSNVDLAAILEAGRKKSPAERRTPAELARDFTAAADALEATLPDRVGAERRMTETLMLAKRRAAAHYEQLLEETTA